MSAVLSKLHDPVTKEMPQFIGLAPKMGEMHWANPGKPGFLGPAHAPFQPNGFGKDDMTLNGVTLDRLNDRHQLLANFDRFRREMDSSGAMEGLDALNQQAFGILTSSRLVEVLDYQKESVHTIERYGKDDQAIRGDTAPRILEQFLIARRLVEAGIRCVTVASGFWDYHGNNFKLCREDLPMVDQGVYALVTDIYERGLDKDISVVVWGEFGRTPTINANAGRDHWPRASCALLSGGGMRTGQAIGSTDRLEGEVDERPVHFQEILATIYHNVGLNVNKATVQDFTHPSHLQRLSGRRRGS